jgi:hypothetical protein
VDPRVTIGASPITSYFLALRLVPASKWDSRSDEPFADNGHVFADATDLIHAASRKIKSKSRGR